MAAPARLWQMRRIHLDRIGSPAARFRDVTIEMTGRDGAPLDTILWMRNGGGKSTLIALVCALIRPDRRDFLATATTGRHLEDCILGADTAHVVVEWVDPTGRRLVTGAVYEWADRVQPADPNAAHDRLRQCWYAFSPTDTATQIETLPFMKSDGRPADFKEFVKELEALPLDLDPVVVTKQERWAGALTDRGLDPGLFTAILKINATEGGIEHHFKFKTADEFVQYLLSLVTDPGSAGKISEILRTTRDRLARQPRLRAEVDFCDEATGLLERLATARDEVTGAERTVTLRRDAAAALAGSLRAAATEARTRVAAESAAASARRASEQDALAQVATSDAQIREYAWWAAHLRHAEATGAHAEAIDDVRRSALEHAAWQIVPLLAEHLTASRRLASAVQRQEEAEAGAEPARVARAEAAALLVAVLRTVAESLDTEAAAHREVAAESSAKHAVARAAAGELQGRLGGLDARLRTIDEQIAAFVTAIETAVADGHFDAILDEIAVGAGGSDAIGHGASGDSPQPQSTIGHGTDESAAIGHDASGSGSGGDVTTGHGVVARGANAPGTDSRDANGHGTAADGASGRAGAVHATGRDDARSVPGQRAGGSATWRDVTPAARAERITDREIEDAYRAARDADAAVVHELELTLPAAVEELAARRRDLDAEAATLAEDRAVALDRRAGLVAEREPLVAEIDALATEHRLLALAEADRIDPVGEHRRLADLLTEEILTADRRRIDLAVADVEDHRASQALESARGLLPAALDLAMAADVLAAARIPAITGWHHLADAVAPSRWAPAIAAAPDLVGGLLVPTARDLELARAALAKAALRPTSAVRVSTVDALRRVVDELPEPGDGFVIAPAQAMFDRTAGAAEAERRRAGQRSRSEQIQELTDGRDRDKTLKDRLLILVDRCPPGHREHLDESIARLDERVREADARAAVLAQERTALDTAHAELQERRQALAAERRTLAIRMGVLADIVQRVPLHGSLRAERDELPAARAEAEAALATAHDEEQAHAAAAGRATRAAEERESRAAEYRSRADELRRIAGNLTINPGKTTLADAQAGYQAADEAYLRQASESALEATIAEINNRLAALDDQIDSFGRAERAAADLLADTPEAADPVRVRRSTGIAKDAHDEALIMSGTARADLQSAERVLAAATARRPEPGEVPLDPPDTAVEADLRAREVRAALDRQQREADAHATEAAKSENRAQAAIRRAENLDRASADLVDDDTAYPPGIVPFTGEDPDREVRAARRALHEAEQALTAAGNALTAGGHRLGRWAAQERFAVVSPEVRDRFRTENTVDELAPHAEALAARLTDYREGLRGELSAIDKDKHLVVTALCAEVREALKTLQRAQNHAQLPGGLGEQLSNRRFLDVGPRASVDTGDAVLRSRVERLVDKLVERKDPIPDGMTLAWEATSAAVGKGNFVARVLKPSTTLGEERQPVELMSKWSGGEKVTISLLLFCMLARLRAANRGSDVPGLGVLPMDNPLGTANYVAFLDLQRRVAAANGIQLIFLSGLGDMRAVGRFPNVVRMRNTQNQGRSYAQVVDRDLNDDALAATITTARLTLPRQERLL
ncbi:cell division protein ZapA [Catenuloplanes japonicus]|uniref:cell division protein ZapA n=1 Tax=Catenuloplanes japonicus TaxID=33876 RepID=UPI00052732C6|nr:cell division protein ZapA [Catenuloplanes japonicus]